MNNNVIHPNHYNIPGRKECIDEMIDVFGYEKVEAFCELNSYKYQYRHELKNGREDLEKAKNYKNMLTDIMKSDPRFKIADHFGIGIQSSQLIEECSELIQAICKISRVQGNGQPVENLSLFKAMENLIEEIADVKLVLDQVIFLLAIDEEVQEWMDKKVRRTLERIDNTVDGHQ